MSFRTGVVWQCRYISVVRFEGRLVSVVEVVGRLVSVVIVIVGGTAEDVLRIGRWFEDAVFSSNIGFTLDDLAAALLVF